MKKNIHFIYLLSFIILTSCKNTNNIIEFLTVKSKKSDIAVIKQNDIDSELDYKSEVFVSLVDESIYLELGSVISLTIDTNYDIFVYEYILTDGGIIKYTMRPTEIDVRKKRNTYKYALAKNIGDGLDCCIADPELSTRGYHVVIGDEHYFYVLRINLVS